MKNQVGVAVIGTGYWGINHVRTMAGEPSAKLLWVCDGDARSLSRAAKVAPSAQATASFEQVLADPSVDAVVLATPATTHANLSCMALEAGKHVLVEKPLATSVADAERVQAAAKRSGKVLLVGHLMLYHAAVWKLAELLRSGQLGELYYLYASRVNLGRIRKDENALWSLAPHDISMVDFLLGEAPESVSARGQSYLQKGVEDVVFVTMKFPRGQMAHIHLSWLDPRKERRLTVVCSQKMVEFDDVSPEKLKIYDKGYDRPPEFTQFDQYLTLRQGDIHIPHIALTEPLAVECRHFLDCVRGEAEPRTGLESSMRVVKVLNAAQKSLERDGAPVLLG